MLGHVVRYSDRLEVAMRLTAVLAIAWLIAGVVAGAGRQEGPISGGSSGMSPQRLGRVTAVMDKYIANGELAGAVALVYRHGTVAYVSARGFQDLETRTPMQRNTIFALASMTKPITAVAAMMLVEEGTLRLDEPVDRLLPELARRKVLKEATAPLDQVRDASRPITVRDLLTYRMGIGTTGYAGIPDAAPVAKAFARLQTGADQTADDYMKRLGELPLLTDPGERFLYNTPSLVTGILVSRASGMPFDQFLESRIFKPLGMVDTAFWVPEPKRPRLATVYQRGSQPGTLVRSDRRRPSEPPVFPSGAGGLVSTVDDYLRFARMMVRNGEVDGVRLLSRKSVELMTQDHLSGLPQRQFFINDAFFKHAGFGFGLQVQTKRVSLGPSVGAYWWSGATGVSWIADPKEDMVYLRMIQKMNGAGGFGDEFQTAVYQAIVD
jgi:CubicO group peptidase (beta-lactamase class C family)